ncbi:MAG: winged helix-turn-helix domain-containing protein [Hydrogenophilales bacterium]|nr:winged helix-turn-helix domain-containing protein [Hydrogenophilales bacterium]
MENARLLIVDDDLELSSMLSTYLTGQGYQVTALGHGGGLDAALAQTAPDLLILDVMLPGEDGLSIARRLAGTLPILMLSARGEDIDRILGLEFGADDYLAKPFNPRELLARIKALLRRARTPPQAGTLRFGEHILDLTRRTLHRNGAPVALTSAEFALLKVLASHPGRVFSRDDLVAAASGSPDRLPFDRSIDARVARLRKKLDDAPDAPRYIRTVWGAGYVFVGHEA